MTSSSPCVQGTRVAAEEYATLFGDNYETLDAYNDPSPFLEATYYRYQEFLDATYYPCQEFLEATYYPCQEAAYEEQKLPSSSYGNWLSNYGSGFSDLFSYGYSTNGNEYGGSLVKAEDSQQADEQYDTDFSYNDPENEPAAFDYNPCYDSVSRYIEELFYQYNKQEARPTYSFGQDEMGFCEGILGYWPCLHRELQRQAAYAEQ